MKPHNLQRAFVVVFLGLLAGGFSGQAQTFTAQVGSPPPPTVTLVNHSNSWHYRKGTNQPQSDWKTSTDGSLDATWLTGPGGFGYEDNDDATVLNDMLNGYTTVYVRQTFEISPSIDTNRHLRLIMDWDDGFVAWLDGGEIARSSNAPGAPGTEPPYSAISLPPNHEASAGPSGNPPTTYDLGAVGTLLQPGTHVLAVQGLNAATNSTDFSLIADLVLAGAGSGGAVADGYFQLVTGNSVELTGSNTIPNSARVQVNGSDAVFNIAAGTWSKTQTLAPGMNRLFIAALDSSGAILASITKDVVSEAASTSVGGTLPSNTTWNSGMGIIHLTNDVMVPVGVTLSISDGVVVLLPQTNSIKAAGGVVNVAGLENNPVFFLPADGTNAWQELSASGTNASLTLRHAVVVAGQVRALNGGAVLVEDSVVRDLPVGAREIVAGVNGSQVTLRRSHVARFNEVDARETPVLIEDCLLERFFTDGVDIKATNNAPLVVRRSTLRFGDPGNANADAVDFGPGAGTVERCLIHDFPDKGVSIGGAPGTSIRESVIYNCGIGISAYASSNLVFVNNTIANCANGIFFRNNPTPAIGTATNLIIWDNTKNVVLSNSSTLQISYSDVQGTNFPGTGNISADPLFANPAAGDYGLALGSPAIGAGQNGAAMGALYPVGGIPSAPFDLAALAIGPSDVQLRWQEDADNEIGFLVDSSPDGTQWQREVEPGPNATSVTLPLSANRPYLRVKAYNSSGESPWSNIAVARTQGSPVSQTFVGGTLTNHTTWTTNMGMIIVRSNVIVPANIVLTILEGAVIKLTNNAAIRATVGGVINVLGTESNKVSLSRWNGTNLWNELAADGTNSSLTIRHADIAGGTVSFRNSASGLIEDSYIHDYLVAGSAIAGCVSAHAVTVRRSHFSRYHETLWRNTLMLVEDSLFENALNSSSDALDFDAAPPGSVIRRCTFRNGPQSNTDAIDIGPFGSISSIGVVIEDCIMHGFTDKGVSIGEDSFGIVVRNCLIYNVGEGVEVKDVSTAIIYNNTIVDSDIGLHGYQKPPRTGGGQMTNTYNNILSGNNSAITIETNSIIVVNYSDTHGIDWPGISNINVNPLFLNPAERDYRLQTNSPCIGTGQGGANMGVTFPVGGVPAMPLNLQVAPVGATEKLLTWQEVSDNESGFLVERSTNAMQWSPSGNAPANATNALVSGLVAGQNYFFRIRATNFIGESFNSNIASSSVTPDDRDGDGMPNDWEVAHMFDPDNSSDASGDADMDGATNLQEYLAGTDPRNAASRLRLELISFTSPGEVELQLIALSNKTYTIQFRDSLTTGNWQGLIDVPSDSNSRPFTITDSVPPGTPSRFYRVVSPQQ